mmetsp:Transcript_137735/g.239502  ORF Transcript_137735/g.239502 Transcript_137735/m.239502 type:complete len:219 (-) Transcript_137735:810-1466(-)
MGGRRRRCPRPPAPPPASPPARKAPRRAPAPGGRSGSRPIRGGSRCGSRCGRSWTRRPCPRQGRNPSLCLRPRPRLPRSPSLQCAGCGTGSSPTAFGVPGPPRLLHQSPSLSSRLREGAKLRRQSQRLTIHRPKKRRTWVRDAAVDPPRQTGPTPPRGFQGHVATLESRLICQAWKSSPSTAPSTSRPWGTGGAAMEIRHANKERGPRLRVKRRSRRP